MATCKHNDFVAEVDVFRLDDCQKFQAEIHIKCKECGTQFRFLGLSIGVDLNGAMVSVNGIEARLAIAPADIAPSPFQKMIEGEKSRLQ